MTHQQLADELERIATLVREQRATAAELTRAKVYQPLAELRWSLDEINDRRRAKERSDYESHHAE